MNIKRKITKRLVCLLDQIGMLKPQSFYNIPIIINNFNRLSMLKKLIMGLELRGYTNIWIIDNNSTYPPLLEWMDEMKDKYHFVRLQTNVGHLSLFETGLYKRFWKGYYIYTDSDISIPDYVPADFVEFLWNVMPEYAVISSGWNSYGHPHPDVLARLADAGVEIYRTDSHGTITFSVNADGSAVTQGGS